MKKWIVIILVVIFLILSFLGLRNLIGESSVIYENQSNSILFNERKLLAVPLICQYPSLPTGCEATAATMVLQFYGEDVSTENFADSWLEKSTDFYSFGGEDFGPDPNAVFVGDPYSSYGYGCYAPVIVDSINSNSLMCNAKAYFGKDIDKLCEEYIDQGEPVLIWASMDMKKTKEGASWRLPNSDLFTWVSGEHCLVLVGYDSKNYYFNDPLTGSVVSYKKQLVKDRYAELGKQAVYISEK